ncbi:MAG: phosphotransferase [Lachnospiraceae bacterium]|nr:phosphotransferase [Lachnospiraceae bacterium]
MNLEDLDYISSAGLRTLRFVDFVKYIHTIEIEPGTLPSAKDLYLDNLELAKEYMTDEQYKTLRFYLEQIPEDHHVVHGDLHMKNVMLVNDEPMLIDMDSLCLGHPIFDLAATIRFLYIIGMSRSVKADVGDGDKGERFIKHGQEALTKLLEEVDGLYFTID